MLDKKTTRNDDQKTGQEVNLTSKEAYKLIQDKFISTTNQGPTGAVKVISKGDNNTFYVTYTCYNIEGGVDILSVIMAYSNGNWNFELPGFSAHGDLSKYNFVNVNEEEYFELNDYLAKVLIEGKRRQLSYNAWTTGDVKVKYVGDNNYYYVDYNEMLNDGGTNSLHLIMNYENGNWNFELPGFSASGDLSKYNFKPIS